MNSKLGSKIKKILCYITITFLVFAVIYTVRTVMIQSKFNQLKQDEIISSQEKKIATKVDFVVYKLNRLIGDVLYVSDMFKIEKESHIDYTNIGNQWLSFSNRMKIYDQIRYIGIDGMEEMRIDYSENGAYIVSEDKLQDKSDYYYFTDTINKLNGSVYFSKIDLNVENKVIEEPKTPVLRISTPIYIDDELDGIVVLNYYASDILNYMSSNTINHQDSIFMLNSDGYWIFNSDDSGLEWAFQYQDQLENTFANVFPNEWAQITEKGVGTIVTENGTFSFSNIINNKEFTLNNSYNSLSFEDEDYYIVTYIPTSSDEWTYFKNDTLSLLMTTFSNNIKIYGIILLISVLIGISAYVYIIESDKIKYFSNYDVMTGVYNRRAGLDKLNTIYKRLSNATKPTSVCFIDIDGLKEVNDSFGHLVGDDLILNVVKVLNASIREDDFIARLGGDEFLIVFTNSSKANVEKIWERINSEYKKINQDGKNQYNISVSHGVYEFTVNSDETIDSLINKADAKMYEEKKISKKDDAIIKE